MARPSLPTLAYCNLSTETLPCVASYKLRISSSKGILYNLSSNDAKFFLLQSQFVTFFSANVQSLGAGTLELVELIP